MSKLHTCVTPVGAFVFGVHKPGFTARNLRQVDRITTLGVTPEGGKVDNHNNFPVDDVLEPQAEWIFEIANPFPFRGATYIGKKWADAKATDPSAIRLASPDALSLTEVLHDALNADADVLQRLFAQLPRPLLLSLASTSTDPRDLVRLAHGCCDFDLDADSGQPVGLCYQHDETGRWRPLIHDHDLFETVANNPFLPDVYKEVMVLRPGVQGGSEIVGEVSNEVGEHVFEYLRRNSYIPWGHYAANMANDAVRYRIADLSRADFAGLRHLYYQRTYVRLAEELGLALPEKRRIMSAATLESLRQRIVEALDAPDHAPLTFDATLWGWNFGYDFAPSGFRLHASHQQIHQQYAMIPATVESELGGRPSYACGDLIAEFIERYQQQTGVPFFDAYLRAIRSNVRMDGRKDRPQSLIVHEDDQVILFVPKAQTSQWELQLMPVAPVGHVVAADEACRTALDGAMLVAQQALAGLGARLVTTIEFSQRLGRQGTGQRLLYSFLPKLPQSMGAFSEAQLRFINGHYPEDFAEACRRMVNRRDGTSISI